MANSEARLGARVISSACCICSLKDSVESNFFSNLHQYFFQYIYIEKILMQVRYL